MRKRTTVIMCKDDGTVYRVNTLMESAFAEGWTIGVDFSDGTKQVFNPTPSMPSKVVKAITKLGAT